MATAKNRIAMFRHMNGMNQRDLGQVLEVGQTTISAWETGRNDPDTKSLHKMATMFNTTIGYLMGYEDERLMSDRERETFVQRRESIQAQRDYEREQEQERAEAIGMTTEEEEEEAIEIQRQMDFERWQESGRADTIEGFLASEIVDRYPPEDRKKFLTILRMADGIGQ